MIMQTGVQIPQECVFFSVQILSIDTLLTPSQLKPATLRAWGVGQQFFGYFDPLIPISVIPVTNHYSLHEAKFMVAQFRSQNLIMVQNEKAIMIKNLYLEGNTCTEKEQ